MHERSIQLLGREWSANSQVAAVVRHVVSVGVRFFYHAVLCAICYRWCVALCHCHHLFVLIVSASYCQGLVSV